MPSFNFIDNLKGLFVSHRTNDDAAFSQNAEAILRSLTVQNCPGEVRTLRDALRGKPKKTKKPPVATPLLDVAPRFYGGSIQGNGNSSQFLNLVSISQIAPPQTLIFHEQTQKAILRVIDEHRGGRKLAQAGLRPKNRLVFWGPPGCGKTAAAKMLAGELGLPFGVVRLGGLITSYVGETGSNLQKVLQMAEASPMVLLLDEADAIAKTRDDENDVGELRRVVNSLLQGLDSFGSRHSVLILASNHTHLFDEAVWRRFDDVVQFPLPQKDERLRLLKHLTSGLSLDGSLDQLAAKLAGSSFADIEKAIQNVARNAVLSGVKKISVEEINIAAAEWRNKVSSATTRLKPRQSKR